MVPSGNKPLPEARLTQIDVTIWRHQAPVSYPYHAGHRLFCSNNFYISADALAHCVTRPSYWLGKTGMSLSLMRKDINYLHLSNVEECYKMQFAYLCFLQKIQQVKLSWWEAFLLPFVVHLILWISPLDILPIGCYFRQASLTLSCWIYLFETLTHWPLGDMVVMLK